MLRLRLILAVILLSPIAVFAQTAADSVSADAQLLSRAELARTYGTDATRATVHEFADPACPTCRRFHLQRKDSLNMLLADKANFVYRFTPIPRLMRGYQGSKAALCAGGVADRAGFEAMLDRLFEEQSDWRYLRDPYPAFERFATDAGLPLEEFRDCYDRDAVAPLIMTDLRLGGAYGATGTPTFAVVPVNRGAGPVDVFYGNEPMRRFEEALSKLPQSSSND